nr:MAG TPA: hypothetical protein [Caudoviricetes sp.]
MNVVQTRCEDCKKRCVCHACPLHNQCRYTLRCKSSKCYCGKYRRLSENGTEQNLSSPHN